MLTNFLAGAITVGFLTIALFFLKFWVKTRDRLFAAFAAAFLLLAGERVTELLLKSSHSQTPALYLMRFLAFLTIIAAIIGKNRKP